ncbi:MAG TPA: GNAT family N-acetyltransferase [Acidimicrobiia bacterium]
MERARLAAVDDAGVLAQLLHDFNTEFDTPTPGVAVLTASLRALLGAEATFAFLVGAPAVGMGLATLRPNVWYDGPVALLDELYVVPDRRGQGIGTALIELLMTECRARDVRLIEINVDESDVDAGRFYRRHGFSDVHPDSGERASYFAQELS